MNGTTIRSLGWCILVLACAGLVSFLVFAQRIDRAEPDILPKAESVVVLTGGADRISDAIRILEQGGGQRLLISGVNAQATVETLRRRWPGHDAVFACCIDLDYVAQNTFENARESRRWVVDHGFRSLVLVTASYHMPRALVEFQAAMPDITLIPYPVVPESSRLRRWWQDGALMRLLVLEFGKYWGVVLRTALRIPGG